MSNKYSKFRVLLIASRYHSLRPLFLDRIGVACYDALQTDGEKCMSLLLVELIRSKTPGFTMLVLQLIVTIPVDVINRFKVFQIYFECATGEEVLLKVASFQFTLMRVFDPQVLELGYLPRIFCRPVDSASFST